MRHLHSCLAGIIYAALQKKPRNLVFYYAIQQQSPDAHSRWLRTNVCKLSFYTHFGGFRIHFCNTSDFNEDGDNPQTHQAALLRQRDLMPCGQNSPPVIYPARMRHSKVSGNVAFFQGRSKVHAGHSWFLRTKLRRGRSLGGGLETDLELVGGGASGDQTKSGPNKDGAARHDRDCRGIAARCRRGRVVRAVGRSEPTTNVASDHRPRRPCRERKPSRPALQTRNYGRFGASVTGSMVAGGTGPPHCRPRSGCRSSGTGKEPIAGA